MRLLLAALAYTLMINLRRLGLAGTELERACTATIRTKLLKIGAAVLRDTRRVGRSSPRITRSGTSSSAPRAPAP